jgi:hypothetical protein
MTGAIIIPEHDTIEFWLASDDGGTVKIGLDEWGTWNDQGCTWMESGQIDLSAGIQPLDLWMYENGGSTCILLAWNIDNTGWAIVPDEAFLTEPSWDTTTTSTTTTTTTSTLAPSTTVPVEEESTTTILQTTTSLSPPVTEETIPETTTTELPTPTTTLPPVSSETSDVPPVVDTIPPVVDTTVPDTLPPDTLPDAPETPETLPIDITEEIPAELVQALTDAIDSGEPLTDEQFATAVEALGDLNEEQAIALIDQLLATDVTADQATELATNPDVLAVITSDQAEEIFATIEVDQLDDTQIAELTEAIQNAPLAVQKAFEATIDIFGGFDDYVPTGSNIPVRERRTLIAIAAGTTLTAAGSKIKRK